MAKKQWVYRPTEAEHEKLMKAMGEQSEYTSVAQFMREGVLRLIHDNDRRKLYTELDTMIEELREAKDKFIRLVLDHSQEVE